MLAQKVTRAMGDKCKATLLDSSNNRWNLPLGAQRQDHCPKLGPRIYLYRQREDPPPKARWYSPPPPRANKPRLAAGNSAMLRWTPAYAGVVAGRRVTVANAGVDSSAQLPNKSGASGEGIGGRHVESSRRNPSRPNPQGAGHHRAQHCWRTLGHSRTPRGTGSLSAPVASMEGKPRRTSRGHPITCPGQWAAWLPA